MKFDPNFFKLNSELKSARKDYEDKVKRLKDKINKAYELADSLYIARQCSVRYIADIEQTVSEIKNCPESLSKGATRALHFTSSMQEDCKIIEKQIDDSQNRSSSKGSIVGAGGAIAGGATAILGPSAAMAIATTFGTASTGVAISTLSGAAATNAALAWLGGGAAAAGGAGIAGGATILGLLGPIGWTIAGTTLIGGYFINHKNNEKALQDIRTKTSEVESLLQTIQPAIDRITAIRNETIKINNFIAGHFIIRELPNDYQDFSFPKEEMFNIVEQAKLLGKMTKERVEI